MHSILCVRVCMCVLKRNAIKNVMHVLLWCVVVISTKNNNYKIIWMPAPAHSVLSHLYCLHALITHSHLLDKFSFLPISHQPSYLTNLIIPYPRRETKKKKLTIIIYAQSFVVTSEIGLTKQNKTKYRNIYKTWICHETRLYHITPDFQMYGILFNNRFKFRHSKTQKNCPHFFDLYIILFHSIFIISISITFFWWR